MQANEIFFDSLYLAFVIFLGLRMFLIKDKDRIILASMTLLLGLGDSFHLVPRIISNVENNGFYINSNALFLGTRISAVTMTIFYILFFYYIRKDYKKSFFDVFMPLLFLLRLVGVIISFNKSFTIDLLSNIPFVLMGLIDIYLLYKNREKEKFKNLYLYVFLSFLFYVPVVLLKKNYPLIGSLMIPKTVMYILIVIKLYKNLREDFQKEDIFEFAISYLFMGIFAGAIYRELGKIYPLDNLMGLVHTHLIVLGFILLSLVYLFIRNLSVDMKNLKKTMLLYNFGLYFTCSSLFLHGLVNPYNLASFIKIILIVISGIGHILLTISLVILFVKILDSLKMQKISA